MADKKISQLTAATTPLAGTEVLPIVQSGTTKKATALDITGGVPVGRGGGSIETNVAIGLNALTINTTGLTNTAVGTDALSANTTGPRNTAFGANALKNTSTSEKNTAVGVNAGFTNSTGYDNIFIGYNAGYSGTAPIANVIIGDNAGYLISTGTYNTFIGGADPNLYFGAGGQISTGSYNVILGRYDGNSGGLDIRTANNYVVLSDGQANIKAYGDATNNWVVPSGNVKLGTAAKGIDFSINSSAAGMTSELLNDYEEGTWTPLANGITFSVATGKYTKIGRFVMVDFYIEFPATASTADAVIGSFPFVFNGSMPGVSIGYTTYGAAFTLVGGFPDTYAQIRNFSGAVLQNSAFSGKAISGTVVYTS